MAELAGTAPLATPAPVAASAPVAPAVSVEAPSAEASQAKAHRTRTRAGTRTAKPARGGKVAAAAGHWVLYFALVAVILVAWALAGQAGAIKSYSMATLPQLGEAIVEYAVSGELWIYLLVSLIRVLEGFAFGLVLGFVLGVGAALSRRFDTFIDLVLQVLRPIPPIAWIPLAILWFGIGEWSKVFIIFLGAFFPIFTNVYEGIRGIDHKYFELGEVYEIPRHTLIAKVVIPAAMPQILTGIRLGISGAWLCVVAAEMIGATSGLGFMLQDGRSMSRPDVVILAMLVIGVVGKLMDDALRRAQAKLLAWT